MRRSGVLTRISASWKWKWVCVFAWTNWFNINKCKSCLQ